MNRYFLFQFALYICLITTLAQVQAQNATVHLYETGSVSASMQIRIDGQKVFTISNHKNVTFSVQPGYHELSAQLRLSHFNATAAIQAVSGSIYYYDLDLESAGSFHALLTGKPQLSITLNRIDAAPDEKTKEERLNAKDLALIASSTFIAPPSPEVANLPVQSLTDDAIRAAILQGDHDTDPSQIGLTLNDTATNMVSHIVAPEYAVSGFTVVVFSPSRWIEYQAAVAKRELRPFTIADVTPDMRIKAMHVVALPSSPDRLNGANMSAASGVLRVVVCSKDCKEVIQPLSQENGTVELNSALRSMDYTKVASTFNMDEVDRIRHTAGEDSFYIAVIGDNDSKKIFRVRNRLFSWY